jgi:hypothetical protein
MKGLKKDEIWASLGREKAPKRLETKVKEDHP